MSSGETPFFINHMGPYDSINPQDLCFRIDNTDLVDKRKFVDGDWVVIEIIQKPVPFKG